MAEHTLYEKKKLCYTEVQEDFSNFSGIGQDPLYKRYDSVYAVVSKVIPEKYRDFLAQPVYDEKQDINDWYIGEWNENPVLFSNLNDEDVARYSAIKEETLSVYKTALANLKGEDFQILSGALKHTDSNDFIFCYDGKVTVVAWGMIPISTKYKVVGTILKGCVYTKKNPRVLFKSGEYGKFTDIGITTGVTFPEGTVLTEENIPSVTPFDGYQFIGWDINPLGHVVTKNCVFVAQYSTVSTVNVRFVTDGRGRISGNDTVRLNKGAFLSPSDIPNVIPLDGNNFLGWNAPTNTAIDTDTVFTAVYENRMVNCFFDAGEFGKIEGDNSFIIPYGEAIPTNLIPSVRPNKKYKFIGWDINPTNLALNRDMVFKAQYETAKRKCSWWKWLLWALLLILFFVLLVLLFRSCSDNVALVNSPGFGLGCTRIADMMQSDDGTLNGSDNSVIPIERIVGDDGRERDDNGSVCDIIGDDGRLPDESVIAPIVGEDGNIPPIISNPGAPDVIANRLNLFFKDDDVNLDKFAQDFKHVYQADEYMIVGCDKEAKFIQIQIPEAERNNVREGINAKLPGYNFFVVDESIFECSGYQTTASAENGWHISAINLKEGLQITRGSGEVVVAIVDDGIDPNHEIFDNRLVSPYNVFTKNNHLSFGEGHGTHVAGLAAGSDAKIDEGISGVAPKCKIMPIQVFDNNNCTISSVICGTMYALHHGADVINLSLGPNFAGLDVLPEEDQKEIADSQFKNEENVWRKVIDIANDRNTIIVFSAGNNNILTCVPPECRTNKTLNVSAVAQNYSVADFSNYGSASNISAPGQGVISSFPQNKYVSFDGTSMAAPIVSGTVALMKSLNKDITISEVIAILQQSGKNVSGDIPPMVQVDKALQIQQNGSASVAASPAENDNLDDTAPGNATGSLTDYDAIRRKIKEHEKIIEDLKKQLPENQNK